MMLIKRYIIKEDTSTSRGNLIKMVISVVTTIIIFEITLYMAFYTVSRNSICRCQSNGREESSESSSRKLVFSEDKRAIMSLTGYMEFERNYLIEHVLPPLILTRRIFPLNLKFISRKSSENNRENNLTLITDCAELMMNFKTTLLQNQKIYRYFLENSRITIVRDVVKMDWSCQLKELDISFPLNTSFSSNKELSYPCFRNFNLPKGSRQVAANLRIQEMSLTLID